MCACFVLIWAKWLQVKMMESQWINMCVLNGFCSIRLNDKWQWQVYHRSIELTIYEKKNRIQRDTQTNQQKENQIKSNQTTYTHNSHINRRTYAPQAIHNHFGLVVFGWWQLCVTERNFFGRNVKLWRNSKFNNTNIYHTYTHTHHILKNNFIQLWMEYSECVSNHF